MKKISLLISMSAVVLPLIAFAGEPAEISADFQVMRVSPRGDMAIIRDVDGRTQMVKVGDRIKKDQIPGVSRQKSGVPDQQGTPQLSAVDGQDEIRVTAIEKDRVEIEQKTDTGAKKMVLQPGRRMERPIRRKNIGNEGEDRKDQGSNRGDDKNGEPRKSKD